MNVKDIIVLSTFFILSIVFRFNFPREIVLSMYQLLTVMFFIGLVSLTRINLTGVKNKAYIDKIRENIKFVRNKFILYFLISTVACASTYFLPSSFFCFLMQIWSIIYFTVNSFLVQKLNEDIFNRVNKK
jgi:hypothetical protein